MLNGFDCASFQPKWNFDKAQKAGFVFCWVKATDGLAYTSSTFAGQWKDSGTSGLLRGAYHFLKPLEPVVAQIERFVATVEKTSNAPELPWVVDVEGHKAVEGVQPDIIANAANTALERLEQLVGTVPVIYTGPHYFGLLLKGYRAQGLKPAKRAMELTRFPLWQAQYAAKTTDMPWPKTGMGHPWTIWQNHGGSDGRVPGITRLDGTPCPCDTNLFDGSEEALTNLLAPRS